MKTYGKQNIFVRTYLEIKSAFQINPLVESRLNKYGLSSYLPKLKRWRLVAGTLCFIILVVTPFTPEILFIPVIVGWMLR